MSNQNDKLAEALDKCKKAYHENPLLFPFEAIISQLEYLINLEKGKKVEYSSPAEINLGWIAVRELDGYDDEELINMLCSISRHYESVMSAKERSKQSNDRE
jgi:hypothetical protein